MDNLNQPRIKYISTPNLELKRKLNEYLTIYNLDEFRTSCLNYKTEERCENMYLPDKKGVERKIHSILRYQTESKRMGCIYRDENAVNNMIKIVNTYLLNKTRLEKFRRDYKFPDKIKNDNLMGAIIFFLLLSVPFFSEKGVMNIQFYKIYAIHVHLAKIKIFCQK
jgi:hypothetical protein